MKLNETEQKIVQSRLEGLSFCELTEKELKWASDQIIFSTAAISGCALPQTEYFADFVSKELIVYITDFGYGELTLSEILLALRLNCKGGLRFPSGLEVERIEFQGHQFHLDYVAKILSNYMALRNLLDGKFKNHIDGY